MKRLHGLIREIHLWAGLVLAVAILGYTVSGAAVAYVRWMPGAEPTVTTARIPLPPAAGESGQALRAFAETELGARGRRAGPEPLGDGGQRLRYTRPGEVLEVTTAPAQSEIVVVTTQFGWMRTLRSLHVLTGYAGGPAFVVWSLLLDLVALAVIGFALSGIYLWFRRTRDRRLGWILLGASWCYTLGIIGYLLLA